MAASSMTDAEMIAELERLCTGDNDREGFYTTEELAWKSGLTKETLRMRLHVAERDGRLEVRKFHETRLGRRSLFTGYRILPNGYGDTRPKV